MNSIYFSAYENDAQGKTEFVQEWRRWNMENKNHMGYLSVCASLWSEPVRVFEF